jgi:tetratricopeptide (TPR) repeat protein
MEQADYKVARAYMTEGLAIARELGDQVGIARALNNLGIVAYHQADYSAARACYEESLAIKRKLGNKPGLPPTLHNLGNIALNQGDYALAYGYVTEAVSLSWELGNKEGIANGLEIASSLALARRQPMRAAQLLAVVEELRVAIGAPLAPVDRVEHDRTTAAVRATLGDAAFDQAWAAGRQMTLEQAVSYALNQVV